MGRRRLPVKLIENKASRNNILRMRRRELFEETKNFCEISGAQAAIIIFSKAGNLFRFGHPAFDEVINRYLADGVVGLAHGDGGGAVQMEKAPPLTEMEMKFSAAMKTRKPAWGVLMRNLGLRELGELEETMNKIRSLVVERRLKEVEAVGEGGGFLTR